MVHPASCFCLTPAINQMIFFLVKQWGKESPEVTDQSAESPNINFTTCILNYMQKKHTHIICGRE